MIEITVCVSEDPQIKGKHNMEIRFPLNQPTIPVDGVVHILCSAISLLVRSCSTEGGDLKEHELMKEVIEHLNEEFGSTVSFNDVHVNKQFISYEKKKITEKNKMDLKEIASLILLQVQHNAECGKDDKFTIEEIADIMDRRVLKPNHCEECSTSLDSGTVFCSADCRRHYWSN